VTERGDKVGMAMKSRTLSEAGHLAGRALEIDVLCVNPLSIFTLPLAL
jgi:hypothetical protein